MDLTGELASALKEDIPGPPHASEDPQVVPALDGLGLGAQPRSGVGEDTKSLVSMLASSMHHFQVGSRAVAMSAQNRLRSMAGRPLDSLAAGSETVMLGYPARTLPQCLICS